ncbi:MAG: response regulator [Dehalococcoidia bacterium]|nr:response regulator [Dehalococcoidia bacterium]
MKALIVEDNKDSRNLLMKQLRAHGQEVIAATSGVEALEQALKQHPDIIISDILMPVMDGFQLCRECKMDENLQDIPFIFYTATYVDEEDEELALMLGADKFIRKPIEPDEFMSIIRGIIGDVEAGKLARQKPAAKDEKEVFKLYSERLVNKLEKKMLDLETEIARHKQTEGKLSQSEEKYRTLFEATADGILIADMETRQFQYANPAMCRMLGYTEEELRTMDVAAIHPKEDLQRVVAEFEAQARGDKTLAPDIPCLRKDGIIVYADISTVNITVNGRKCNSGFFRDITERKKTEQQALVNAKLASVGELVAGVAHEINNPLTGIIGYAQLLADRRDVPQNVKEDLQKIYEESKRTVKIVQNLLRFARQYKPEKSLVDINELLERTLELEAYKMRTSNIELSTKLAADMPLMLADYNQLQQVILNIITNAQQATAETKRRCRITVTTETVEEYVRISIADNGPGISPENMTKIFDPFFTTKPEGSGSGLGLSVCHGIITEHGGNIYAESTIGKGTTFIIELPIATGEQAVIKEKEPAKKKSRRPRQKFTGNILIVEDEPSIRAVLTRNLSVEGYQVQTVPDGKAALDKLAKNAYDLIFTDLKMPGMSGRELYEAIKKKHPNSAEKVVFITGDVMTGDTTKFLTSTGRPYLVKPFYSKDVTDIIEKVIGG